MRSNKGFVLGLALMGLVSAIEASADYTMQFRCTIRANVAPFKELWFLGMEKRTDDGYTRSIDGDLVLFDGDDTDHPLVTIPKAMISKFYLRMPRQTDSKLLVQDSAGKTLVHFKGVYKYNSYQPGKIDLDLKLDSGRRLSIKGAKADCAREP